MDHKNEFKKCFPDLLSAMLSRWIRNWNKIVGWRECWQWQGMNVECGVAKYLFYSNRFSSKQFCRYPKKVENLENKKEKYKLGKRVRIRKLWQKIYMPEESTPSTIAQMALPCINKKVVKLVEKSLKYLSSPPSFIYEKSLFDCCCR